MRAGLFQWLVWFTVRPRDRITLHYVSGHAFLSSAALLTVRGTIYVNAPSPHVSIQTRTGDEVEEHTFIRLGDGFELARLPASTPTHDLIGLIPDDDALCVRPVNLKRVKPGSANNFVIASPNPCTEPSERVPRPASILPSRTIEKLYDRLYWPDFPSLQLGGVTLSHWHVAALVLSGLILPFGPVGPSVFPRLLPRGPRSPRGLLQPYYISVDTYHSMTHYSSTATAVLPETLSQGCSSHDSHHRRYALAFDSLSAF